MSVGKQVRHHTLFTVNVLFFNTKIFCQGRWRINDPVEVRFNRYKTGIINGKIKFKG